MTITTHFIETIDGAWIKGVPCLIPNLQEGQFVITMDGKEKDYRKWRWRIDKIETIIGSDVDLVLQEPLQGLDSPAPSVVVLRRVLLDKFYVKFCDGVQRLFYILSALSFVLQFQREAVLLQFLPMVFWPAAGHINFLQPILTDHKPNE